MSGASAAGIRVLVTGASGFVGAPCTRRLVEQGAQVHAVSSSAGHVVGTDAQWHCADLLVSGEAAALVERIRPTHLLHLAWETSHGRFWDSEQNLRWLAASLELVRAFAAAGGRRAVLVGTCAEYRWNGEPSSERTTPLEPRSLYGACKHALHVAAEAYARSAGVSLAWARLFFLFGPGEGAGRLVPSLVAPLLRGEPAACSSGDRVRDFLHVDDAAAALTAVLASEVAGPVNVASGVPTPISEVARIVGELTGHPELVVVGTRPAAADDPAFLVADVSRLTREVGWRPAHDLGSGLRDTVGWWREREVERVCACS
jgi:nucleoside-diphosphate-sugar epimerase